ncbi:glycosyltransferase family 1 protein [Hydnum rufescens UP504]|uniref:Sterol 3-beta-glucosyltransferase n=1 Tax=Hydnum rufescens UP504 TaxID=1448309 RepID=A0A9P6E1Q7_9AGAM|nr:glycosyltransferase family 1 protein [Hydnum rufescens UP504]
MFSSPKRAKSPPPDVRNHRAGTTINSDPKTVQLEDKGSQHLSESAISPTGGSERHTNIVKRVIMHTADKLSHSTSIKRSGSSRLASALRRSKAAQGSDMSSSGEEAMSPLMLHPLPFRQGTQTLIQALQAIPWEQGEQDDDDLTPPSDPAEFASDDDAEFRMSSSIHTIHPRSEAPIPEDYFSSHPSEDDEYTEEADFDESIPATQEELSGPHNDNDIHAPIASSNATVATIRLKRRSKLAGKLREVFDIADIKEVVAVLQGYMYLTNSHLCFFAHMPSREDQVLKSGTLSKKASRTKRWNKHWFVLKNDVLSWYHSSTDPYFPHGNVDLRYAISCDAVEDKGFKLRTNQKTISLSADSTASREEWVKTIRKIIFKAQNLGESVKIAIPYSLILDIDRSTAMDFSETIEVKEALEQIREVVRKHRQEEVTLTAVTCPAVAIPAMTHDLLQLLADSHSSGFRLTSLLRSFSEAPALLRRTGTLGEGSTDPSNEYTHVYTLSPLDSTPAVSISTAESGDSSSTVMPTETPATDRSGHRRSWSGVVPNWLRPSLRIFPGSAGPDPNVVTEVLVSPIERHDSDDAPDTDLLDSGNQLGFSMLEVPDSEPAADAIITEKFRQYFAFDDKEILIGHLPGSLFRVLPVSGKMYVSTNYFCFRSSQPLTRTRMIIPIRDVLSTEKQKAFRFGHHGLVVIIKGYEELFFEFGSETRRNSCIDLLEHQMNEIRQRHLSGETVPLSRGKREALLLSKLDSTSLEDKFFRPPPESESLPAVMFTSMSSTFLSFKPTKPLRFTCLTIGSRGDVQPYIALCKGLMADGHKVRIATHVEFKDWIEGHGIEFGYVGGDPAELMRICVENGMFTVSFLKEAMQKFRGWIDDLLKTSWEACQGTDVLIESPNAMGGLHIAEALGIPYFRAFTMPWTRTRAYPHAFAVPDRKTYVVFDQVFWRGTAGQINRWRRNVLGLESTNLDKMEQHKVPFLYNFSPTVVPPPLDWYEWIHITGYWFLNDADDSNKKKWTPPEGLLEFIDGAHAQGKPVVYIGFGSVVVSDPDAMTRCVVEAIIQSGVHAILSKGWSDRLSSKKTNQPEPDQADPTPLPPQIYPLTSVPHDWLFPRINAACHHGGAGTTGASLRAGIPTIIKPFFGDQFFWADRVEALGIGSGVRKLTVDSLTEALRSATTDPKQIERARLVGEAIRAENGVTNAVEAIYRDLEYARSLIKRPSQ